MAHRRDKDAADQQHHNLHRPTWPQDRRERIRCMELAVIHAPMTAFGEAINTLYRKFLWWERYEDGLDAYDYCSCRQHLFVSQRRDGLWFERLRWLRP